MSNSNVRKVFNLIKRALNKGNLNESDVPDVIKEAAYEPEIGDNDFPVGIDTILASSKKLLDINRGLTEPDERDSLAYRSAYTPDKLLGERIKMDADKIAQNVLRKASKKKSLKSIPSGAFSNYAEGLIIGNVLSSPIEEINPAHMVEQARRFSQMGTGGLPSDDSITPEAQNLHWSEFGFLDLIAGPESSRIGVDTRAAQGVKIGSDGRLYRRYLDRRTGKRVWLNPMQVSDKIVGLPK